MIWFVTVARTILYLWVGLEFSNLAYIYYMGYNHHKPTPIIKSLQIMMASLSVLFFGLAFLPVLLLLDKEVHQITVSSLPIILLPVGFAVRWFRSESLRRQTMKLPSKRKKK